MKKYFILADIHSHFDLLLEALEKAEFDFRNPKHILIIAGDVLDRGHQGAQVLNYLEELIVRDRVMGVLGNHDEFLASLLENRYKVSEILWNIDKNGFGETLRMCCEYPGDLTEITKEKMDHVAENFRNRYPIFTKWLLNLPLYLEFKNHVIVHAFLDFSLPDWHDTTKHFAIWERRYNEELPDCFTKKLIFGHTPNVAINDQHDIIFSGNKIMIDGGAGYGHQVNVLCIDENKI